MTAKPARSVAPDDQREHRPAAELLDYGKASIKFRRQITDLERFFEDKWNGPLPDTEAAHHDAAVMLDLLAVYIDRSTLMDDYLERCTSFNEMASQRLKEAALGRSCRGYSPTELGRLAGLTWATRMRLGITNITAIDTPPADFLEARRKAMDASYQKAKRASERQNAGQASAGKRKAAELQKRRSAAICTSVGFGRGLSVSELCKRLRRLKHSPFSSAKSAGSLPEMIRRTVKADTGAFLTEIRPIPGRPDLRPQLWISRRPQNAVEYQKHFTGRLGEFTAATASDLARWFNSPEERCLRENCGFERNDERLVNVARARRDELIRGKGQIQ